MIPLSSAHCIPLPLNKYHLLTKATIFGLLLHKGLTVFLNTCKPLFYFITLIINILRVILKQNFNSGVVTTNGGIQWNRFSFCQNFAKKEKWMDLTSIREKLELVKKLLLFTKNTSICSILRLHPPTIAMQTPKVILFYYAMYLSRKNLFRIVWV